MGERVTPKREDGFFKAAAEKAFPALVLKGAIWGVLRHPIRFDHYIWAKDKEVVGFFFACASVTVLLWKFDPRGSVVVESSVAGALRLVNAGVHLLFPRIDISGFYLIPLMLLVAAGLFALIFHVIWLIGRFMLNDRLKRIMRKGPGVPGRPFRATLLACVLSSGLLVLTWATLPAIAVLTTTDLTYAGTGVSLSVDVHSVREAFAFAFVVLDLYLSFVIMLCTPVWLARIYGLRAIVGYAMVYAALFVMVVPASLSLRAQAAGPIHATVWNSQGFHIYFNEGSADVYGKAFDIVDEVAKVATASLGSLRQVGVGGAIETGEAPTLSRQRALNIAQSLVDHGIARAMISVNDFGDRAPLVKVAKSARDPRNRYAVIWLEAYGQVVDGK